MSSYNDPHTTTEQRIRLPFWLLVLVFGLSVDGLLACVVVLVFAQGVPMREFALRGLTVSALMLLATMGAGWLLTRDDEEEWL